MQSDARTNVAIARRLDELADLLEVQHASAGRVDKFRGAARALDRMAEPLAPIVRRKGMDAFESIPGLDMLARRAICQLVTRGSLPILQRLRGKLDVPTLLGAVVAVGKRTAQRAHEILGIESLEELEVAAHDGRLAALAGMGAKRLEAIRTALATLLGTRLTKGGLLPAAALIAPSVADLLYVDETFRKFRIKPDSAKRTGNADREPASPGHMIIHLVHHGHNYTVMEGACASGGGLWRDRVSIMYDGADRWRQCMVVTEQIEHGPANRLILGRELECRKYHAAAVTHKMRLLEA
ncbi:MAG: hypothetical protein R3E77_09715 [Steroidobacteraceae bacterium]